MNAETFCEQFATFAEAPHGVAKLRELILQLAVQGKLGTQDVNDEPAMKLLERITAERQRKENDEGARIQKSLPPISPDEMPYELPTGWAWERLGNIGDTNIGLTYSPDDVGQTGVPVLRSSNIQNGKIDLADLVRVAVEPKSSVLVEVGDLLICARNGSRALVGKVALIENLAEKTAFGAFMAIFRSGLNQYLYHFICSPLFRRVISDVNTTTINQITQSNLRSTLAPIPPLAEQRRIVGKVDQLLGLCDELAARQAARREARERLVGATLDRLVSARSAAEFPAHAHRLRDHFDRLFDTPTTLPQLRQAILQLAVQGQLVPQDVNDEPASVSHRDADSREGEAPAEPRAATRRPSPIAARQEPRPPNHATTVSDFVVIQNGYAFKSEWFVKQGTRLVRNVNVGHDELRWDELACVTPELAKDYERFNLTEGDIVISLDRPLISTGLKVARIGADDLPCLLLQRVGRTVFKNDAVSPEYFNLWLHSPAFTQTIDPGRSNGVPHISAREIEAITFSPPPLSEQKRIVSKVTELLSLCDALEAKLTQAESASTQLLSAAVAHLLQEGSPEVAKPRREKAG